MARFAELVPYATICESLENLVLKPAPVEEIEWRK
jgi:hypothetical protein